MDRFPIGLLLLIILSLLIYLGLGHRVLDRMRLSDRAALMIIAALLLGSLIDIPLAGRPAVVSVNDGGALVPLGVAVYLLAGAGTREERTRAIWGAVLTGAVVYFIGTYLMRGLREPAGRFDFLDPLYLYPLVAGAVAYATGRSRRAAFVAATLGVLLGDIFHYIRIAGARAPGRVDIGGGGVFDAIVLSGIFAVLLAEVIGEVRERIQGGPSEEGREPALLTNLRSPESSDIEKGDKGGTQQ
uniref:DUF1614 domain-containing protein n=1 Tax=Ammonifex degensii TaxID=42838 RepID=A0A7C2ICI8_9THEO